MDAGFGNTPPFFEIVLAVILVLFLVTVVGIVISVARSRRVLRDNGLDPLAARAQIAARIARGPLAAPAQNLEQRLSELDDLHRRGVITDAEHSVARRAALGGEG
jgi:hypothetical protein